jgi:hypothetical protein
MDASDIRLAGYPAGRISGWPDIRPDNPVFFDIRYPAGYQIAQPDIRPDIW